MTRTLVALAALGAVAVLVPMVDAVRQGRAVAMAAGRAALQLGLVGLVLGAVFTAPLAVLPVLAVMVAAATITVSGRLAASRSPAELRLAGPPLRHLPSLPARA